MKPISRADFSKVKTVFTDVDGTLTTNGVLRSSTLASIESLTESGIDVVLVSGRSSGCGEAWARQWPVRAVIVENGALYYTKHSGRISRTYLQSEKERIRNRALLQKCVDQVLKKVKGAQRSMDSLFTEVDVAVDYNEDVKLGAEAAKKIEDFLRKKGAQAVRSSVHVNTWLGTFNKRIAVEHYLQTECSTSLRSNDSRYVYVGDSLNDAPMFEAFSLSVGVANVTRVLDLLAHLPKFVTKQDEGAGFEEVARWVMKQKRK